VVVRWEILALRLHFDRALTSTSSTIFCPPPNTSPERRLNYWTRYFRALETHSKRTRISFRLRSGYNRNSIRRYYSEIQNFERTSVSMTVPVYLRAYKPACPRAYESACCARFKTSMFGKISRSIGSVLDPWRKSLEVSSIRY
jgi:hypothetical protein